MRHFGPVNADATQTAPPAGAPICHNGRSAPMVGSTGLAPLAAFRDGHLSLAIASRIEEKYVGRKIRAESQACKQFYVKHSRLLPASG
jgi:hypothetical protein